MIAVFKPQTLIQLAIEQQVGIDDHDARREEQAEPDALEQHARAVAAAEVLHRGDDGRSCG